MASDHIPGAGKEVELEPTEYKCSKLVSIRKCESTVFPWGESPAFWYITKPLFAASQDLGKENAKALEKQGFRVAYWNGADWAYHTPKKFNEPREAFEEFAITIRPLESRRYKEPAVDRKDPANLEVIRWRSCEEDPPDHCGNVLIITPGWDGTQTAYCLDVGRGRAWYQLDNYELIGNIKGCMWAEMPRGPG